MGAAGAVAAGLSAVSGIVSYTSQQKQASAQRKALASQQQQQQLQAELQLFAIRNQRLMDSLQDALVDAAQRTSYLQTDAALRMQERLNELAAQNAIFASNIELLKSGLEQKQKQLQAAEKASERRKAAAEEFLSTLSNENQDVETLAKIILSNLEKADDKRATIATLLDMGAASGGINEALVALLDSGAFDVLKQTQLFQRKQQERDQQIAASRAIRNTFETLADVGKGIESTYAGLLSTESDLSAKLNQINAAASADLARRAFESQRLVNDQSFKFNLLANDIARQSRYLQNRLNEQAVKAGTSLALDTLEAQKQAIRPPGFFDFLAIGMNAATAYKQFTPPKLV
jgi:hypothetical protein